MQNNNENPFPPNKKQNPFIHCCLWGAKSSIPKHTLTHHHQFILSILIFSHHSRTISIIRILIHIILPTFAYVTVQRSAPSIIHPLQDSTFLLTLVPLFNQCGSHTIHPHSDPSINVHLLQGSVFLLVLY